MISDVRDYLKARLKEEFTTAKEHKDAFNDENISLPKSGVKFFIEYANSSNLSTDGNVVDIVISNNKFALPKVVAPDWNSIYSPG